MAYLLQKISVGAGWLLLATLFSFPAFSAPFSHRIHLEQKLTCVTCHTTAVGSAKAADNNLPAPAVCATCHVEGGKARPIDTPIKPPRTTMVTKFNHQLHNKLGNIAPLIARAIDNKSYLSPPGDIRQHLNGTNPCMTCHRGLEHSDETSQAAFPAMADCLICHTKIDPPFSCEKCHDEKAQLKPASHTPDYLDRHTRRGTIEDRQSCAVCHGRTFTCLGCH